MLFECLKTNGIFVIEELDFPDTRKDMNIFDEKPTLKQILLAIKNKKDLSLNIFLHNKKIFLENVGDINIFKELIMKLLLSRKNKNEFILYHS